MAPWLINSLVALVCFGLWGFLPKIAVRYVSPRSALVYEALGVVTVGCIVLLTVGKGISTDMKGIVPAVLTGIFGTVGFLCFLYAVNVGGVSVVATLTALYPAITILLAVIFLKESVTLTQIAGIGLAIVSVILLSRG
ncbi:MAG TPA: EamA family transporter [Syntrophobacteria bacterium]|nr:EamA family transporter [Syntrophobacteria bacterium]